MGVFKTVKTFYASPSLIPAIVHDIANVFAMDGYEVKYENLNNCDGGCDMSLSKGGLFRTVLGLKTALKVKIIPGNKSIMIDAGIGIFGQQVIPTIITMFIFWPVILSQLWGIVKQSQLDDRVMIIAANTIARSGGGYPDASKYYG